MSNAAHCVECDIHIDDAADFCPRCGEPLVCDDPRDLPISPRERALVIATAGASGVLGYWVGITSVPDDALMWGVTLPAPTWAPVLTLLVLVVHAWFARIEWQLHERLQDGDRDA